MEVRGVEPGFPFYGTLALEAGSYSYDLLREQGVNGEVEMAWAFTRYSSDYIGQERQAIEARAGVHAHDCERAWDWRAAQRAR